MRVKRTPFANANEHGSLEKSEKERYVGGVARKRTRREEGIAFKKVTRARKFYSCRETRGKQGKQKEISAVKRPRGIARDEEGGREVRKGGVTERWPYT